VESIEEEEGESDPQGMNLSQDADYDSSQIDNYTQVDGKRVRERMCLVREERRGEERRGGEGRSVRVGIIFS
jgi:hypothetical protein